MTSEIGFADFMRRIRAGDEEAAFELVRRFEPLIRREVRLHLEDSRLSRSLDSVDVSQSVLAELLRSCRCGTIRLGPAGTVDPTADEDGSKQTRLKSALAIQ